MCTVIWSYYLLLITGLSIMLCFIRLIKWVHQWPTTRHETPRWKPSLIMIYGLSQCEVIPFRSIHQTTRLLSHSCGSGFLNTSNTEMGRFSSRAASEIQLLCDWILVRVKSEVFRKSKNASLYYSHPPGSHVTPS